MTIGCRLPPTHILDFSRHQDLFDHALLARTRLTCIGLGGASGLIQTLTRCGIERWMLVDFDCVNDSNPTTQAHDRTDRGRPKAHALAARLAHINPLVEVNPLVKRYSQLSPAEYTDLWRADLVLAMTDDFATQSAINRDAIRAGVDTIFAICYIGCQAVEITASFPNTIAGGGGCHRCHTKARYDAYADGFQNPTLIASHALAAEYLNALIGLLVVSHLHQRAGSSLPIASVAREFTSRPCLITRIIPSFGTAPGEAFADLSAQAFTTRLWPLDTPSDWTCPDCGTRGVVPPTSPLQRPLANPGPGPTEGASTCTDPCCPAVFAAGTAN